MRNLRPKATIPILRYEAARSLADKDAAEGVERVVLRLDEGQTRQEKLKARYVSVSVLEWNEYFSWADIDRVEYVARVEDSAAGHLD